MVKIAEYDSVANFGGVLFSLGNTTPDRRKSTLKTNIGKTFVEKNIPLRNKIDIHLRIQGIITGLSRDSGETLSTAIERDRTALIALEDGYHHSYADGKHSGDFAIISNSLRWLDEANRESSEPNKFTMELIQW